MMKGSGGVGGGIRSMGGRRLMLLLCELNAGIAFTVGYTCAARVWFVCCYCYFVCVDDVVVRSFSLPG